MRFVWVASSLVALVACRSGDGPSATDAGSRPSDEAAAASRASCTYGRGALAAQTLGASARVGKQIPIDTLVVLMQENRSFDHYFSHLGKYAGRTDIDSAPDTTTNPDSIGSNPGKLHPYQHAPHLCNADTNHEWSGSHIEWNFGALDGFYQANSGWTETPGINPALLNGERALWWYDERDIPFYYELATTFGVGDRHFSPALGPTWPNRMYAYAGTSFGMTANEFPNMNGYDYPIKDAVIFDMLEKAHISWLVVSETVPGPAVVVGLGIVNRWGRNPIITSAEFFRLAAEGALPQVLFYDNHLGVDQPTGDDEHPPADIQVGQKAVSDIVHALFKSPQWPNMALFLTYDEHGGYYDHVAPPKACAPDKIAPFQGPSDAYLGGFDQYGFRVPLIVVSPFAKAGYVSHEVSDHTSILRFIEARFDLPALTARDANANALLDYFDFRDPPFLTPPTIAEPGINQAELDYCELTFRK